MKTRGAVLLAILVTAAKSAAALEFGINPKHAATDNQAVATLMSERGFTSARIDMFWDRNAANLRDRVQRIQAIGGKVQVVLQVAYQWDHSCDPRLGFVEQTAYRQTATAVHKVKDLVHEFELLNEAQLRPEIKKEVPPNSAGLSPAAYESKPCVATLVSALRGMSRAIADIRASSGLPLRIIMGVVGRDFGYLTFMRSQGIRWDVIGYHLYPRYGSRSLLDDPWYGPGGPFTQLASFNNPIHLNEFNCGEIYDADYENRAGEPKTEACLKSLSKHLKDIRRQGAAKLEYVHFYELLDEPMKAPPENRFGLMHDMTASKPHLFLATALAGGQLSLTERQEVTRRGLLTDAEIDQARSARLRRR